MEGRNKGKFIEGHKLQSGELNSNWRGGITGNYKLQHELYKKRHPLKWKVQKILNNAVTNGKIIKPNKCSECGKITEKRNICGHHDDYSKPFEVKWVCRSCHNQYHIGHKKS